MGMMTNLLGTLPSATFKKDAEQTVVLAMTTPNDPSSWSVGEDDDTLRITVGATEAEIDLTPLTLQGLQTALSSIGLSGGEVTWNGSATLLVPGQSGQVSAGGTLHFYGFTSPLWAILRPYDRELRIAQASGDTHAEQLILTSSQQYWVDFWGSYFGVRRRSGEDDTPYIERIIAEVFRARNTKLAIEQGIKDSLGWDVLIQEPWRNIFTLCRSRLSGFHHLQGDYYRYHIIHPVSEENVDWELVEEQVHLLRPAGTLMWEPNNWAAPNILDLDLPTDLITGEYYGLYQQFMELAGGNLSRDLTLSRDYYFLRVLASQSLTYYPGGILSLFYADTGDPSWDDNTWTSYTTMTWREKSEVSPPILAQCSVISPSARVAWEADDLLWETDEVAWGYSDEIE